MDAGNCWAGEMECGAALWQMVVHLAFTSRWPPSLCHHTHPRWLQNSSAPRSSYAPPLITGIAVQLENGSFSNDTNALLSIESQGGRLIAVYGNYFGPTAPNLLSGLIGEGVVFGTVGECCNDQCVWLEGSRGRECVVVMCALTPSTAWCFVLCRCRQQCPGPATGVGAVLGGRAPRIGVLYHACWRGHGFPVDSDRWGTGMAFTCTHTPLLLHEF